MARLFSKFFIKVFHKVFHTDFHVIFHTHPVFSISHNPHHNCSLGSRIACRAVMALPHFCLWSRRQEFFYLVLYHLISKKRPCGQERMVERDCSNMVGTGCSVVMVISSNLHCTRGSTLLYTVSSFSTATWHSVHCTVCWCHCNYKQCISVKLLPTA